MCAQVCICLYVCVCVHMGYRWNCVIHHPACQILPDGSLENEKKEASGCSINMDGECVNVSANEERVNGAECEWVVVLP